MASLVTHPLVPLAAAVALGRGVVSPRLLAVAIVATLIADADVVAFTFGIPYASPFGHRGFTHSIAFAVTVAAIAAYYARRLVATPGTVFAFVLVAAVSHPLLDACTNGGLGVALVWPISDARMFAPWRPLEVSPIGIKRFLSPWGARVLLSECVWVWMPALTFALGAMWYRKKIRRG